MNMFKLILSWFIGNWIYDQLFPPKWPETTSGSGPTSLDTSALADLLATSAFGKPLPNIKSVTVVCSAGNNEIVAGLGGKRIYVLAYVVTAAGAATIKFRNGASVADIWRLDLSVPAGNSGANLAASWPSYLFVTDVAQPLTVNADSACTVAVTYWEADE